ncbi:MAG: histidinol dehydrogenase [Acidobacteria bacterium]|nr:MAG: histidinol dehydrogenase [Acidobacteriota bacterium]
MIETINSNDRQTWATKLKRIRERSVALNAQLMNDVAKIIHNVRIEGDAALIEYAALFDGVTMNQSELRMDEAKLSELSKQIDEKLLSALRDGIANVRAFHERQRESSWEIAPTNGVRLGQRIMPISKAGLYVPGGTASYPSSLIMNVVPAQVAGVERIVVATPPNALQQNPAIAAALIELGVTEVYAVGGAQAIAALAYGTETVAAVDKITGAGNRYVAAAKKLVFGVVGIDSIAGPSEVVILADDNARADFIAADLLAQAEHDEDASSVLITTSETLAREVAAELDRQLSALPRKAIAEKSLAQFGALIVVSDLDEGVSIINDLAPEHLEIVTGEDEAIAAKIKNSGAIFFGSYTPEAVGDYFAGPNHVLPTGGAARFSSALGVYDFMKRTSMLRYSREALAECADKISTLASAEGLAGHARSAMIRVK